MNSILLNKVGDLALVEGLISQMVDEHPETEKKSQYLAIVCDEIISNIFNNNNESVTVEVQVEFIKNNILLTFIDNGKIFDITDYKASSDKKDSIDRPVGGLGISIVKKISNEIVYQTIDGKNQLNIKIKI